LGGVAIVHRRLRAQREYELVLMLDPGLEAAARDAVANEAKGQIEAAGTLKHENVWGLRKLAYEIAQRNEADYRWFRFEAPTELLEQLDHNLKIADGVLRFRIFKVDADTPVVVPPATSAPGPGASRERSAVEAPQAPSAEIAPEAATAEAPAPAAPTAVAEPPAEEPAAEAPEPAAEAAEAEAPEASAESTEADAGAEDKHGDSAE
jgi:small subunit ribosomal protein S6